MAEQRAAVVVGVGACDGLGAALSRRFAREGLHIFIAGRTAEKLDIVAEEIRAVGGKITPVVTDATCEEDVAKLFRTVSSDSFSLALVVYNVGTNARIPFLEIDSQRFEALWRQNCFGGFLVGQEAVRHMLPHKRGTILFTGATASLRARPPFTAFAAAKASLRAVAQGMARDFGPQGIHVAHMVIDGAIDGEQVRRHFSDIAQDRRTEGMLQLDAITDTYWAVHCQQRSAWTHELDLRPFKEPF